MNLKISVVIPSKDFSYFLTFENLPALDKQTYRNFETIVIVDYHSQYDLALLKKYRWLTIISSGKSAKPAQKRDLAAAKAQGDIIAFIDDDAYPDPLWLKKATELFKNKKISAVCGPGILPPHAGFWERVGDAILRSWFGAGGYQYRFMKKKQRFIDDYPSMNFLIRTHLFKKLGGFNSTYWPGEDSKLCNDLVYEEGGKILYDPSIVVYHHRRNSLHAYLKQHANYGYHRGAFFAQGDQNSRKLSYLAPTFFVLYLILCIAFAPFFILSQISPVFFLFFFPFVIYLSLLLYTVFVTLAQTKNTIIAFTAPIVLFLMHLTYGILFIKGFYKKNHIYG